MIFSKVLEMVNEIKSINSSDLSSSNASLQVTLDQIGEDHRAMLLYYKKLKNEHRELEDKRQKTKDEIISFFERVRAFRREVKEFFKILEKNHTSFNSLNSEDSETLKSYYNTTKELLFRLKQMLPAQDENQ